MAYPVTLNGRTYTLADFEGTNYVEGLPDAFEDFVTHAGDIYNSTSTTSNTIGTGSKTFTVESAKPYQAGTPLRIADASAPSTNFIDAIVTSYSGTTLVVDSVGYAGSGTFTSWNVNIGGSASVAGTVAIAQGGTGATTAAAARTNLDVYSKADADSRFLNVSGEASDVTMTGNVTIGDAGADTLTINAATTTTANISFGDSDKAIFGAGSDLQIYHDGSNSHIEEVGGGNLRITTDGPSVAINKGTVGGENMAVFNADGAVQLFYDNSEKLATTNTGVDITGTLTSDGLTVDNNGSLIFNDPQATDTILIGTNDNELIIRTDDGDITLKTNENKQALRVSNNGDISFYEDTGTTAKFFWDASAESLGIGTSSPSRSLHISGGTNSMVIERTDATTSALLLVAESNNTAIYSRASNASTTARDLVFNMGSTEAMRITENQHLFVGTTDASIIGDNSSASTGTHIQADGQNTTASYQNSAYRFNRMGNSGSILEFRNYGAATGDISVATDSVTIGAGDVGLFFNAGGDNIFPTGSGATALTGRDAAVDLGRSAYRFKDLYLSGGVYLGGTGSANKLDDYEEGTFSGTIDGSSYDGHYTKVGRIVHISVEITNTTATGNRIASLPFSARNTVTPPNGTQATRNTRYSLDDMYFAPYNGGASVYAYNKSGGTQGTVSGGNVSLNFVYETDD